MKKIIYYVLICVLSISVFAGCGNKKEVEVKEADVLDNTDKNILEQQDEKDEQFVSEEEVTAEEEQLISEIMSEEQALDAIKRYCYIRNPDLESIVDAGQYPVYWVVSSSDENEIVVLFRSYTGAQNHYYIDRNTGDAHVTEFVPGISNEEERTDEIFNARDYLYEYEDSLE